jgi:transposase
VVSLIFKRLKTGCQWRELSIKEYFFENEITWQGVYYYYNKWSKDDSWKRVWISILRDYKQLLDLSSIQLDGSHTIAKRGGSAVGYQGRKSAKTSNSLFLCDNTGQMLTVSSPQSGEHNDLFNITQLFEELTSVLIEAGIEIKGLFMNADAGFDKEEFREACSAKEIETNIASNRRNQKYSNQCYQYFDELLYKRRTKIEHANAWMDSFKALLVRFETIIKIIQLCYIRMHILHTLYSKLYTLCCKPILKLLGKDTTYLK